MRISDLLPEARMPKVPSSDVLDAAAADGFDVSKLWYHGTRRRFDAFRLPKVAGIDELGPGVYVTAKQWLANSWARKGGFVLTCVVRQGPLFDLAKVKTPEAFDILHRGHSAHMDGLFGPGSAYDPAMFTDLLRRRGPDIINLSLSAAGYVGAFKHDSQIEGQIVVFKPEDVRIVARQGGKDSWGSFD